MIMSMDVGGRIIYMFDYPRYIFGRYAARQITLSKSFGQDVKTLSAYASIESNDPIDSSKVSRCFSFLLLSGLNADLS